MLSLAGLRYNFGESQDSPRILTSPCSSNLGMSDVWRSSWCKGLIREFQMQFSLETRVLLLRVSGVCDVDLSFGLPGYESELMNRRVDYPIGEGRHVKLCSAEDLVILKMLASRPRDLEDVEGILLRQGSVIDRRYIRLWLREFSDVLENPELLHSFERLSSVS
jgi:hypothetical protein